MYVFDLLLTHKGIYICTYVIAGRLVRNSKYCEPFLQEHCYFPTPPIDNPTKKSVGAAYVIIREKKGYANRCGKST